MISLRIACWWFFRRASFISCPHAPAGQRTNLSLHQNSWWITNVSKVPRNWHLSRECINSSKFWSRQFYLLCLQKRGFFQEMLFSNVSMWWSRKWNCSGFLHNGQLFNLTKQLEHTTKSSWFFGQPNSFSPRIKLEKHTIQDNKPLIKLTFTSGGGMT